MRNSNSCCKPSTTEQSGSESVFITCVQIYSILFVQLYLLIANAFSHIFSITVNTFTLFFTCCSGAPWACVEEVSHGMVLCRSSQSATCSTGSWNSTWQILHIIGWLVRVTGWLEEKVIVTSLEQPAWRCPTWRKKSTNLINNGKKTKKTSTTTSNENQSSWDMWSLCLILSISGPPMKGGWAPFTWLCPRIRGH